MDDSVERTLTSLAAVLGRARVFGRLLCFGMQREFDFVRSLNEWSEKLSLLRSCLWGVDRLVENIAGQSETDHAAIENCRRWLFRANVKLEAAIDELINRNTPGIWQSPNRHSTGSAMDAVFVALRDVTEICADLESAQAELGLAASDRDLEDAIRQTRLPEPPGVFYWKEFEQWEDQAQQMQMLDPLGLCLLMRRMLTAYGYAFAIGADHETLQRFYKTVEQRHAKAVTQTENLLNDLETNSISTPATLILECRNASAARLERLSVESPHNFCPSSLVKSALPASDEGLCRLIEPIRPLTSSPVPRILLAGDPESCQQIQRQLGDDYVIDNLADGSHRSPRPADLVLYFAAPGRAVQSQTEIKSVNDFWNRPVPLEIARAVYVGPQDLPLPDGILSAIHYSTEPLEQIDRHFVQVYLTANVSDEWCQTRLDERRSESLANLDCEWLLRNYLLPTHDTIAPYEYMPNIPCLWAIDRLREGITETPGTYPSGFSLICKKRLPPVVEQVRRAASQLIHKIEADEPLRSRMRRPLSHIYGLSPTVLMNSGPAQDQPLKLIMDDIRGSIEGGPNRARADSGSTSTAS